MKKKIIILIIILVVIISITSFILIKLHNNSTFYSEVYHGRGGHDIFIPKYSYLESECCFTAANFYSFRSKKELEKEINNYLKDFEYFDDENTYGYRKGNLFIQSYEVIDKILYRKIIITY